MSSTAIPGNSAASAAISPEKEQRKQALQSWLAGLNGQALKHDSIRTASADASFRQYYRVDTQDGNSLIAVDAPPATENSAAFIKMANLLKSINLTVPEVLAHDLEQGFMLVTDLGMNTYGQILNSDNSHKLYMDAIDSLILLQAQSQADVLPEYDRAFLQRE